MSGARALFYHSCAFQILAMFPAAAGLLYGLVSGLLGKASSMLPRLALAVGIPACGTWCLVLFMPELILQMIRQPLAHPFRVRQSSADAIGVAHPVRAPVALARRFGREGCHTRRRT